MAVKAPQRLAKPAAGCHVVRLNDFSDLIAGIALDIRFVWFSLLLLLWLIGASATMLVVGALFAFVVFVFTFVIVVFVVRVFYCKQFEFSIPHHSNGLLKCACPHISSGISFFFNLFIFFFEFLLLLLSAAINCFLWFAFAVVFY